MAEAGSKALSLERLHKTQYNHLLGTILDFKYNMKIFFKKLWKSILFAEPVKLNFGN